MPVFSHLHSHTQYSLLDGQASISALMKKAQKDEMPAVALTDHGNMFGAFNFVAEANKYNVKPIVGCEFYMVADRHAWQRSRREAWAYHEAYPYAIVLPGHDQGMWEKLDERYAE